MSGARDQLLSCLNEQAVVVGAVTLTSGQESHFYVDGKRVTLDPLGASLLSEILLETCRRVDATAIGGPCIGADPMAGSVAARSAGTDRPVRGFIVRRAAKAHGMQRRIEGPPLSPGDRVVLVDDVISTGGSVLEAAEAIRETGARIVLCTCLVDRLQGARSAMEAAGIPFEPIFTREDLILPD